MQHLTLKELDEAETGQAIKSLKEVDEEAKEGSTFHNAHDRASF